jgi:hypothetical protein
MLERQGLGVLGFRVEDVAQIDHAMKRVRMFGFRKAALHEHVSGQYRARTQRLRLPRAKTRWRISSERPSRDSAC